VKLGFRISAYQPNTLVVQIAKGVVCVCVCLSGQEFWTKWSLTACLVLS